MVVMTIQLTVTTQQHIEYEQGYNHTRFSMPKACDEQGYHVKRSLTHEIFSSTRLTQEKGDGNRQSEGNHAAAGNTRSGDGAGNIFPVNNVP